MSTFPDPRYAPSDIVAMGEDLRVETLREAYRKGIFPWPHDGLPLPWFSPRRRAVIFFDELHVGRSLRKSQKGAMAFTIDRDFRAVIQACADAERPDQDGTWIAPQMIAAYTRLHDAGDAHSVEVWEDDSLVGGLYGVDAGGIFTGESMFHLRPDASKLALLFLIERLCERGATMIDCQVMTPHMEALGAREIPRARFLDALADVQAKGIRLFQ
ncbi:MAG TPA: leucyl/phenylalanyl-tRNA--protein transferase [Thermoanaerobaculia bacterium]|jgi:leucyl/phenylalanyl-tRNA--protein transferase|nr:leucyl/phenylalanyl-tRNA--protein transferase [Thermoanaerobaculia bacterium]